VHYDFDSGTKYISYFVPSGPAIFELSEALLMHPEALLGLEIALAGSSDRTSIAFDASADQVRPLPTARR
jgi:hypothetical protein